MPSLTLLQLHYKYELDVSIMRLRLQWGSMWIKSKR